MKEIQNKIKKIVSDYKDMNPREYMAVCKQIKNQRDIQANELATLKGEHYIQQLAHIVPETLDRMLSSGLSEGEWKYFQSKKGAEWFGRTFKEFSPAYKI